MLRFQLMVAGICLVPFVGSAQTSEQTSNPSNSGYSSRDYRQPQGFGGYVWNTPLGKVDRLAQEPVYVRVAHSKGKITNFDNSCYVNQMDRDGDGIINVYEDNIQAMRACRETEGDGYHALAEYYVESQGFRFSGKRGGKVVLFPITYQFCAHWRGFSNDFKGDPLERMHMCGVRFYFRSETDAQKQAIVDHTYRTAYEQTLRWLIDEHGEPEEYERDGEVLVPNWETEPGSELAAGNRHRNWYWCRPQGEALVPDCKTSIVLAFDAETGWGQVLYLTNPVWAYAYARQFGGADGDPLYRVLHGGIKQLKVRHNECVDSFLCRPPPPGAMPEKMLARFRLANKADVKN